MRENGPKVLEDRYNGTQAIAVGSGAVAYSAAVSLTDLSDFALEYKVACTGTPDVKIEMQQCSDGVNWYTPKGFNAIEDSVTDKAQHGAQITPITVEWVRFKITENTSTVTDTVVTLKINVQRKWAL